MKFRLIFISTSDVINFNGKITPLIPFFDKDF